MVKYRKLVKYSNIEYGCTDSYPASHASGALSASIVHDSRVLPVDKSGQDMYYYTIISSLIDDLQEERKHIREELSSLPQGTLYSMRSRGRTLYYHRMPPHGFRTKEKRVGITRDEEMIHQLARKRFLAEEMKVTQNNLKVLQKAREEYVVFDPESCRHRLGGPYADLPSEMFAPVMSRGDLLLKGPGFMTEGLIHVTAGGTAVRSKSELVIAGRLEHHDIEFVYEPELFLDGISFRPDFEIRRCRDGKLIYWEHAGMMTDPEYRQRHAEKMIIYEQNDIVPWSNLLVTYDDPQGGLDVKLVDGLIRGWLL